VDWVSAEAEAVEIGAHLITINSADEQAFVEKTFLTPPDSVFWIRMTDAVASWSLSPIRVEPPPDVKGTLSLGGPFWPSRPTGRLSRLSLESSGILPFTSDHNHLFRMPSN
jgi:hypothetical protein